MLDIKSLSYGFARTTRTHGESYYAQHRVTLVELSHTRVRAIVRGTQSYRVTLEIEDDSLDCGCTCPYAQDQEQLCKHIWATLLQTRGTEFGDGSREELYIFLVDPDHNTDNRSRPVSTKTQTAAKPKPAPVRPKWEEQLAEIERATKPQSSSQWQKQDIRANVQRYAYVIDPAASVAARKLVLTIGVQVLKKDGDWGGVLRRTLASDPEQLHDPHDRRIHSILTGAEQSSTSYYSNYYRSQSSQFRLGEDLVEMLLTPLGESGRLFLAGDAKSSQPPVPVSVDTGAPFELALDVANDETGTTWRLTGRLERGEESVAIGRASMILPGVALWDQCLHRFRDGGGFAWIPILRKFETIEVPVSRGGDLACRLLSMPRPQRLCLPDELKFEEVIIEPRPRLVVKKEGDGHRSILAAELFFIYDDVTVPAHPMLPSILQPDRKRAILRSRPLESAALQQFHILGVHGTWFNGEKGFELAPNKLAKAVQQATAFGWLVEAEGKLYRRAGVFEIEVKTETDWFDLAGAADFEGKSVPLPRLLDALRQGIKSIVLDDGSVGMLPDEWLKKYGLIANMGTSAGETYRFKRAQVGVLDALLASRPEIAFDKQFEKARGELKKFDGVVPADPPAAFTGELRGYQREGLGWLRFLRKFGFGGCLADDMGLGKTVQVLAHLTSKRKGPALVVVPKSLIFNWKEEAARFAPKLKVLDHTGPLRERATTAFPNYDLILTTYGTLRRDASLFAEFRFDTCVLDESQAAKNANTDTAKAVKLIQADHRLALSGTPVENHLGELWTLFDFLNPGMLGRASTFGSEAGSLRNPGPEGREFLARALKPYILRRTKRQVAKDLPEKTEQTIFCELEAEQRNLYDELRDHYRASLLSKVDELGLKRTKIQVLAALLRLRQAACHPGLIDPERTSERCAKLDALLPQIQEVIEEGHKVLVFSQFTSFLSIVKYRFDDAAIEYEYLDGKTRDRADRVRRFQTDPDCRLFLVSLKAGGVGLNLTSADYVYLLDPWWNPAVEAQAIDRTHRIGQSKPVFAYRIIARNTVEEKVLELQKSKKELADAILGGDDRLITQLKREDLELLLS